MAKFLGDLPTVSFLQIQLLAEIGKAEVRSPRFVEAVLAAAPGATDRARASPGLDPRSL